MTLQQRIGLEEQVLVYAQNNRTYAMYDRDKPEIFGLKAPGKISDLFLHHDELYAVGEFRGMFNLLTGSYLPHERFSQWQQVKSDNSTLMGIKRRADADELRWWESKREFWNISKQKRITSREVPNILSEHHGSVYTLSAFEGETECHFEDEYHKIEPCGMIETLKFHKEGEETLNCIEVGGYNAPTITSGYVNSNWTIYSEFPGEVRILLFNDKSVARTCGYFINTLNPYRELIKELQLEDLLWEREDLGWEFDSNLIDPLTPKERWDIFCAYFNTLSDNVKPYSVKTVRFKGAYNSAENNFYHKRVPLNPLLSFEQAEKFYEQIFIKKGIKKISNSPVATLLHQIKEDFLFRLNKTDIVKSMCVSENFLYYGSSQGRIEKVDLKQIIDNQSEGFLELNPEVVFRSQRGSINSLLSIPIEIFDEGIRTDIMTRRRNRYLHATKQYKQVIPSKKTGTFGFI